MKLSQLYTQYHTMPQLQTHMLRVGAIAKLIMDDKDVVLTALLHDMGNMAKFKLDDPYWQCEQVKFRTKYGNDAHVATDMILREVGLVKYADYLIQASKFYENTATLKDFQMTENPVVITLYGDLRVAYEGVVTLEGRYLDLEKRYGFRRVEREWGSILEKHIQTLTKTVVSEITEEQVVPLFDELLTYEIE